MNYAERYEWHYMIDLEEIAQAIAQESINRKGRGWINIYDCEECEENEISLKIESTPNDDAIHSVSMDQIDTQDGNIERIVKNLEIVRKSLI